MIMDINLWIISLFKDSVLKLHFLWNPNEDLKLKLKPVSYGHGQIKLQLIVC